MFPSPLLPNLFIVLLLHISNQEKLVEPSQESTYHAYSSGDDDSRLAC